MDRILFLEDINNIFIYYLNKPRASEYFARCEAILSIDNCPPHMRNAVIAILTPELVRAITFTAYTAQISHVLEATLCSALKKHDTGLRLLERQ
jgi:hypothetical protein